MKNDWINVGTNGTREKDNGSGYVNRTAEDRLGKVQKKKKSTARYALTLIGYLTVLVLVMYLGTALYVWIDEGITKNATEAAVAAGIAQDLNLGVVYSQADLDAQLAEAAQQANARVEQASLAKEEEILGGIKANLTEGNTMVETLRPYYPNELVLVSNGTFHFVPISDNLKRNSLQQENLQVLESGEYQYVENGQVVSHKGIDVSKHQGKIDWQQVAADGVEFAFIRAGLRGYTTGKLVEDEYFEDNVREAAAAGIKVGVYVYSQAVTEEEILEEADLVLNKIAPYTVECPIVIDVEKVTGADGRMNNLTLEERTNLVLLFCQTVENAGYKPMIYHNMEMGVLMLDLEKLENYDKWFASYNDTLYYPYDYAIWQYSDKGKVNGISTDVDLNISFAPVWE